MGLPCNRAYRAECRTRPGILFRIAADNRVSTILPGTVDSRLTLLIIEPVSIALVASKGPMHSQTIECLHGMNHAGLGLNETTGIHRTAGTTESFAVRPRHTLSTGLGLISTKHRLID